MTERKLISKNAWLSLADRQYKKDKLTIELSSPLTRDSVTGKALLPLVMSNGTVSWPDIVRISRRLDALYGASLSTTASAFGSRMLLRFDIESPCDAYLPESGVGIEAAKLLLEVLFSPATENGVFRQSALRVEGEKLRDQIRAQINNKRDYCIKQLKSAFFGDDVRGLPGSGFEEDIPGITAQSLFTLREDTFAHATAEVFYAGRRPQEIERLLADAFRGRFALGEQVAETAAKLPDVPFSRTEQVAVEQDKLAMLWHSGALVGEQEAAALRVANCIFGAAPTSRLFMSVREKQSLCYYCASRRGIVSGAALTVDSGVSRENTARMQAAVAKELALLSEEGPTQQELAETKLLLRNSLRGVTDSVGDYAAYHFSNIRAFGRPLTLEEELARIDAVTTDDVKATLSSLKYCGSCRLTGEET